MNDENNFIYFEQIIINQWIFKLNKLILIFVQAYFFLLRRENMQQMILYIRKMFISETNTVQLISLLLKQRWNFFQLHGMKWMKKIV